MINRVLDLQSLTVRQITKPLTETVIVAAQTPLADVLTLARERGLTRLPVWDLRDGQQRIIGLATLNTLLYEPNLDPNKPVGEHVRPALYLKEDQRLEIALRLMRRSGQRLAVVLALDQKEVGVVSLEDILKVVFGEVKL